MRNLSDSDVKGFKYEYDPRIIAFEKTINHVRIKFKTEPQQFHHKYIPELRLKSGMRPVPPLIWDFETTYQSESLKVRAFKKYNSEKTVLYKAPFLNASNSVCLGSSEFDMDVFYRGNATEIADSIIKSFFNSAFSHASDSKQTISNIITLSAKLLDAKEFPMSELIPSNTSLVNITDYEND